MLKCKDSVVVKALEKRVGTLETAELDFFEAFMQADLTIGMFDKYDEDYLNKSKAKATDKQSSNWKFIKQFHKNQNRNMWFSGCVRCQCKCKGKGK